MLYANTSKARIGGKDINVPAPPKATRIRGRVEDKHVEVGILLFFENIQILIRLISIKPYFYNARYFHTG